MSGVAFNINGEPFEVPAGAAYWRPRRVRDRGLEVVYQPQSCVPLMLPITITAEEFQREVGGQPGKYRLDALDEEYQAIERMPPAYLVIAKPEAPISAPTPQASGTTVAASGTGVGNDNQGRTQEMSEMASLLREVVRANAEVSKTIAEKYASVLESAALLVRAADGAGMPARTPPEPRNGGTELDGPDDEDVDDNDDVEETDELSQWSAFAREWAPSVLRWFGFEPDSAPRNSKQGTPSASNAGAKATPPAKDTKATEQKATEPEPPAIPKMTPAIMIRLNAIKNQLTDEEAVFLKEVYGELSPAEVAQWMTELASMPVDEAVALLRAKIAASATPSEEVAS